MFTCTNPESLKNRYCPHPNHCTLYLVCDNVIKCFHDEVQHLQNVNVNDLDFLKVNSQQ